MYLHDIIAEEATLSFTTEPTTQKSEGIRDEGHLFITSILQKVLSVKTEVQKTGDEFGSYQKYFNSDVELEFAFSKGNMGESVSKQKQNYLKLAKMLTCLDAVIENAVGIEVHNRNDEGYKVDDSLKNMYVLASAFTDGTEIVPVKLEVKEFNDKENTLHVAIALESIKADEIVKQEVANGVARQYSPSSAEKDGIVKQEDANGVARQYSPPSNISIAEYFKKINPKDESFYTKPKNIDQAYLKKIASYEGITLFFACDINDGSIRKPF